MAENAHSATGSVIASPLTNNMPPAALMRLLSRFNREQLASFVEVAIDLADLIDGDPDMEPTGDEFDSNNAEDEILHTAIGGGPGCTISDPDAAIDDSACDDINDDREPEHHQSGNYGIDQTHMLPYSMSDDQQLMREHLDRIRRNRCDVTVTRNWLDPIRVHKQWRLKPS